MCGGAYLRPGDLIVGDADGVVIAPAETAQPLMAEVEELIELETRQDNYIDCWADLKKRFNGSPEGDWS